MAFMRLNTERFAHFLQRACAAELRVFVRDEFCVFVHEGFARWAEIEIARLVAEVFAMNAGPYEPAIRVDVHLGHA